MSKLGHTEVNYLHKFNLEVGYRIVNRMTLLQMQIIKLYILLNINTISKIGWIYYAMSN